MSDREILTARLIDRPIRPLFPEGYSCETQVVGLVLSADPTHDPSTMAINGASAALAISDIPFHYVLGGVRVAMVDGKLVVDPTYEEQKTSKLNIVVAATAEGIVMVEAGANEATEDEVLAAIEFGHECCKKIVAGIQELVAKAGKPKRAFTPPVRNQEIYAKVEGLVRDRLSDALDTKKHGKTESYALVDALEDEALALYELPADKVEAHICFELLRASGFSATRCSTCGSARTAAHSTKSARSTSKWAHCPARTVRPLFTPRRNASVGDHHARDQGRRAAAGNDQPRRDLEASDAALQLPAVQRRRSRLHARPGPARSRSRRAGPNAASPPSFQRKPNSPTRYASSATSSNPTARPPMATVCGAILSMMDAGVKIKAPVAGIAMGLVKEDDKYRPSSPTSRALEDHYGDMDFKVAGTRNGITGLQMDIKVPNISIEIMREALAQAKAGRLFILGKMDEVISEPRTELSPYAPRIYTITVPTDKIREIMWPRRQDDPQHHGTDRNEDRHPRRRHGEHLRHRRRLRQEGVADHLRYRRRGLKSARRIWAKWSASPTSARSWRSSRAPTAC